MSAEGLEILRRLREGPPLTQKERRRHQGLLKFAAKVEKALAEQPWWQQFLKDTSSEEAWTAAMARMDAADAAKAKSEEDA